ncbi:hypothetical protein RRG08_025603 [Elysia crispata]|uniref:Uncharacterized protein n=1 Tax=Elysia crispata TaxID=231223 RepID=A0AAE1CXA5_9GAST|nr:hypothetical protein RRG08_025603 [Elysia crispata]
MSRLVSMSVLVRTCSPQEKLAGLELDDQAEWISGKRVTDVRGSIHGGVKSQSRRRQAGREPTGAGQTVKVAPVLTETWFLHRDGAEESARRWEKTNTSKANDYFVFGIIFDVPSDC